LEKDTLMPGQKTLQQRQTELQALLATPAGRKQLEQLEAQYRTASGRLRPGRGSVITYLLVYEREQGLLSG